MSLMRMLLLLFGALIIFNVFVGVSFSYLENRYFCRLENNTIIVVIKQDIGSTQCVQQMQEIESALAKINNQIVIVNAYIRLGEDLDYWLTIKEELVVKKNILEKFLSQYRFAMDDFEKKFFVKIMQVLTYYLNNDKKLYSSRLTYVELQQSLGYTGYQSELLFLKNKVSLINQMLVSTGFQTLLPPLVDYLYTK